MIKLYSRGKSLTTSGNLLDEINLLGTEVVTSTFGTYSRVSGSLFITDL